MFIVLLGYKVLVDDVKLLISSWICSLYLSNNQAPVMTMLLRSICYDMFDGVVVCALRRTLHESCVLERITRLLHSLLYHLLSISIIHRLWSLFWKGIMSHRCMLSCGRNCLMLLKTMSYKRQKLLCEKELTNKIPFIEHFCKIWTRTILLENRAPLKIRSHVSFSNISWIIVLFFRIVPLKRYF